MTGTVDNQNKFSDSLLSIVKGKALYSGDSRQAFEEITRAAAHTLAVQRASIWMYNDQRRSIRMVDLYEVGTDSHSSGFELLQSSYPNYFDALRDDRVIDAKDAHKDRRTSELSETYLTPFGINSMLDGPIQFAGETIGVICLEHVGPPRIWQPDEITYAGSLADLVSHAVEAQKRSSAEAALLESEAFARNLFENNETAMWVEDLTELYDFVHNLDLGDIEDIRLYLKDNEDDVRRVFESIKRRYFNRSSLKLFGARTELALQNHFASATRSHLSLSLDLRISELIAIYAGQPAFRAEIDYLSINGEEINSVFAYPIPKTRHEFKNIPISVFDLTDFKKLESELLTQSQIINNIEEGTCLIRNRDNCVLYTNPAFDKLFGYDAGELLGKPVSLVNAPTETSSSVEISNKIRDVVVASNRWRGEILGVRKDGAEFWASVSASAYKHPQYGDVRVSVTTDISDRKALDQKLSYHASHDDLTGLINRYEFEQRVTRLLASVAGGQSEHAMCFLDLDQFKVINDTSGHAAGDELLRQLGRLLGEVVRKRDTLARLGGDEFGVLMEHCSLEQANRVANDILEAIKDYQFLWGNKSFHIGASIGLVAITETSGNFTEVFKQADAACYLAKDLGRNRIHTYHPDDCELAVRHGEMQWVGRINEALEEDQFCLYAQPILSLEGEGHRHYELLVRMIDEHQGTIPPGAFLPAAERYSLIGKIDAWVVNHACDIFLKHPAFIDQVDFVTINLSGSSLNNKDFLGSILQILKKSGVSPQKICFEVTETVAVSNLDSAIKFIKKLKQIGCSFALDDFGSGISSFGYLKNLPVDYLKIDGMFVQDIIDDPIDRAMVKSINEIGQVMGKKTIAEFVENDEIKAMLQSIGVNYGQGYGLGKPVPLLDLVTEIIR